MEASIPQCIILGETVGAVVASPGGFHSARWQVGGWGYRRDAHSKLNNVQLILVSHHRVFCISQLRKKTAY